MVMANQQRTQKKISLLNTKVIILRKQDLSVLELTNLVQRQDIDNKVRELRRWELIQNNLHRLRQNQNIIQYSGLDFVRQEETIQNQNFNRKGKEIERLKTINGNYNQTTKKQKDNHAADFQNTIKKNQENNLIKNQSISQENGNHQENIKDPIQKIKQIFKIVKGACNPDHIKKHLFKRQNYKQDVNKIIQQFYQQSFLQRNVQDELLKKHVRQVQGKQELLQEYNIKDQKGLEHINQFVTIRGDGNCLFTSLMIQILAYYQKMENRHELNQLIKKTPFNCYLNDLKISLEQQQQLKFVFQDYVYELWNNKKPIEDLINNPNESFYGLMVIFIRNLFHQLLQDEEQELHFMINQPENVDKILEWEHMYDETEIALKMFADKYQFNIKVYSKMNIDQQVFDIQEYRGENQNGLRAELGLAFQPGHYNALFLNQLRINNY